MDYDPQAPTLTSAWEEVAGLPITAELLEWPPDLFALTDVLLDRSQAYRFALSPHGRIAWPPARLAGWSDSVVAAGGEWSGRVGDGDATMPELAIVEWDILLGRAHTPLEHLAEARDSRICEALLTLHAIADEACAGLGGPLDASAGRGCSYRARGRELLTRTGSVARMPAHRLRVLPKARTASSGTSVGSLARYACVVRSEVEVRWHRLPTRRRGTSPVADHANLLLLPWPLRIRESDFRAIEGSVHRLAGEPFGLFEFAPSERLDLDLVDRMLIAARDEVDNVDAVILAESAIKESDVGDLEAVLDHHGVGVLHTGVRQCSSPGGPPPANWVHTGVSPRLERGSARSDSTGEQWFHIRQHKHNRWLLDEKQIYQYHLGGALHPHIRWWEAMDVPRRSVHIIQLGQVTVTILVCEDLAQNDRVSEVLRSVGPTVVLTPLLDGPQLASRWSARYASVFADDPGSAVLTLTSLGMAQRSRPGGLPPSPVVAMWKDPVRGTREIPLEAGAQGVLLTACTDRTTRRTRDGRMPVETGTDFFDVSVHQVRPSTTGSSSSRSVSGTPRHQGPPAYVLEVDELTILTSWAEAVAEALASAPEHLEALLVDARAGAPWRAALGIVEPSAQLDTAIRSIGQTVQAAMPAGSAPAMHELVGAVRDAPPGERGPDALARRVLRSALEARIARQATTGQ